MTYGYRYDPPGGKCSGGPTPGALNLRFVVMDEIAGVGDSGIYNCRNTRTGSNLSLHGVGRAWDARTVSAAGPNLALNAALAEFFVAAAEDLGIQRVIAWGRRSDGTIGPREWDSRVGERFWERYSGPLHQSHNHVELCALAAQKLTRDEVRAAIRKHWKGPTNGKEEDMAQVPQNEWDELKTDVAEIKTQIAQIWKGAGDNVKSGEKTIYEAVLEDVNGGLGATLAEMERRIVAAIKGQV